VNFVVKLFAPIVAIFLFGFYLQTVQRNYTLNLVPQSRSTLQIRADLTSAHLWIEEILSGDSSESPDKVWLVFEGIDGIINTLANGGQLVSGKISPIDHPPVLELLPVLQKDLDHFREVAKKRLSAHDDRPGTDLDQQFDRIFGVIIEDLNHIQTRQFAHLESEQNWILNLQYFLGLIVLVLLLSLFYFAARHEIENKVSLRRLEEKNEHLELMMLVVSNATEAIVITDYKNRVIEVNPSFERISGYSKLEILGQNPSVMSSGRHDKEFYRRMWEDINTKDHWHGEVWDRRKNGELYPKDATITKLRGSDRQSTKYVAIFSDKSKEKKSEEKLMHLAFYDPLTGLANRAFCTQELAQRLTAIKRRKTGLAVLFIDLDGFKGVNDSMGHKMGDEVLIYVAKHFKTVVRSSDLVCRHGGDEFLIILPDLEKPEEATLVATQLVNLFKVPILLSNNQEVYISCSIGISFSPDDSDDPDTLIRYADTAMYQAKKAGKGRFFFFSDEIEKSVIRRMTLDAKLHRAVNNREFVVYYQPQVDSVTGAMVGMESLVRWQNPDEGLISPGEFIPLAEETGVIKDIGNFVLEESCRQNKAWQDAGLCQVVVSVNCSVRQFEERNLPELVEKSLLETGLEPKYLKMEITESLLMVDPELIIEQLRQLRSMGVGVSMDDFGTGYSSLSILQKLPLTDLKIDRAFIKNITEDHMIAQVVADLAENMKLHVVAEGAEEWEQIVTLNSLNCNTIQGFYYSKPLDPPAFEAFVKSGSLRMIEA